MGVSIEPLTTFFPEQGPNANILLRKFRKIFNPNSTYTPGRQVFSEEEVQAIPQEMFDAINGLRSKYGLPPVERK